MTTNIRMNRANDRCISWTVPSICQQTAEQQSLHIFGFFHVIYAILNASVILKRNETRLERNEIRLERNEMRLERNETRLERNEMRLERNGKRLERNETRGGNLLLSGTVFTSVTVKVMDIYLQKIASFC